ncbi:DUF58 domain-containing protein [Candidatus Solincola tengchongensis]|uniref:DUF58 domain-containing protein n=1 Tax=Candidatus Solincola tengchongensis TaxID=2900693 RepID=UPI00257C6051|nr:DUF58 domain-containing protein [Candidatus Solincola tengchongensis]
MFSARSLIVVALSLAMILIGINSQSGWLFWLAGLLLAALLVSWLESLFQVRGLEAERLHPPGAVEGEDLEIEIRVRNGGRFARHLLAVVDADPCEADTRSRFVLKAKRRSIREALREALAGDVEAAHDDGYPGGAAVLLLPRLPGGEEEAIRYRRSGLRRGIYRDWPLYFYSEGTLGLSRHSSRITPASRLEVYPRYAELASFPFLDALLYPWRELLPATTRGEGLDFYGVREYRPGDPLGRVHWKTTARRGELVVREFEAERSIRLVVLLDNRGSDSGGWKARDRLDAQARVAATAAAYAFSVGCPVTLAAYRGPVPVAYEAPGLRAALRWLAALESEGEPGPTEQLEGLRHMISGGALVCQIVAVSSLQDLPAASRIPQDLGVVWILVEGPDGNKWNTGMEDGGSLERILRHGSVELPPYVEGVAVCGRGDDIAKCLENPCVTCAGLRRRGI